MNKTHKDSETYDNDTTMEFIFIQTYQVHTLDPLLFCFDTVVSISCTGDNAL